MWRRQETQQRVRTRSNGPPSAALPTPRNLSSARRISIYLNAAVMEPPKAIASKKLRQLMGPCVCDTPPRPSPAAPPGSPAPRAGPPRGTPVPGAGGGFIFGTAAWGGAEQNSRRRAVPGAALAAGHLTGAALATLRREAGKTSAPGRASTGAAQL